MADLEKVLGKTGAKKFWDKVWGNVKILTGDVAYKTKGDLQTQVNAVSETASTAKSTADDAKTAASDAAKAASTAKETADSAKAAIEEQNKNFGGLTFDQDPDGNWGYRVGGADPVIPFKSISTLTQKELLNVHLSSVSTYTITADDPGVMLVSFASSRASKLAITINDSDITTDFDVIIESNATTDLRVISFKANTGDVVTMQTPSTGLLLVTQII